MPITEFYVFQTKLYNIEDYVTIAVRKDDFEFRCWSSRNDITSILKTVQSLSTNYKFGWSSTADSLGPLIVTYSIELHPEYFL